MHFKKIRLHLFILKIKNTMESLNYTDLATIVLVLCCLMVLLTFIAVFSAIRIKQIQNDFLKEDEVVYKEIEHLRKVVAEEIGGLDKKINLTQQDCNYIAKELNNLKQSLIKPKYNIGDRILCTDGERGVVIDIERLADNSFWYTFRTRKYFNHASKELKTSEFGIANKY